MTSGKRAKAQRRAEQERHSEALKAIQARRRRGWIRDSAIVLVVLAGVGTGIGLAVSNTGSGTGSPDTGGTPVLKTASLASLGTLAPVGSLGPKGPEGIPVPNGPPLADTSSEAYGSTVDGIECQSSEQALFHIHVHVSIFVDGSPRQIPAETGIVDNTCLYWLHTHAPDGVIHVESPVQRTYTLGDFFDEWGQPLGPNQVGPANGHVVAMYNGKLYVGNPRDIPLNAHAQIQLEVGSPLVAPESITSWASL